MGGNAQTLGSDLSPLHKLTTDGWHASLAVALQRRGSRTALTNVQHFGPLRVQRPFYPEGDEVAHLYLLHPPGGVVAGDHLAIEITVGHRAHVVITTPGAAKFYRSTGGLAGVEHTLRIADEGTAEWLPQENIYFSCANVESTTRIELGPRSQFMGWDIQCYGRPASGECFAAGRVISRFEIWRDARPLSLEYLRVHGDQALLTEKWGLGGHTVNATFWCTTDVGDNVTWLRDHIALDGRGLFAVTSLSGLIVCRFLGDRAEEAKYIFSRVWALLRPRVFGRPACPPRIWAT